MGRKPHLAQDLVALPNGNMIALTARAGGDLANKGLHKEHSYILWDHRAWPNPHSMWWPTWSAARPAQFTGTANTRRRKKLKHKNIVLFWAPTTRSFCVAIVRKGEGLKNKWSTMLKICWKSLWSRYRTMRQYSYIDFQKYTSLVTISCFCQLGNVPCRIKQTNLSM